MCEFETPSFVYYSHTVVIILSLITGFLILTRNPKHPMNRNAFYFIFILALWVLNDLVIWTTHDVKWNMFFNRISYLADFAVLFFLYFAYHFTRMKINFRKKILLAIPYVVLAVLAHTKLAFTDFNYENCDYTSGPLMFYLYLLDFIYISFATCIFMRSYRDKIIPLVTKVQIKILICASWFFVLWVIVYEEIGRISSLNGKNFDITPYFLIGNLLFVSLIAFAMIKKDLFEYRNVPLDWFTVFLWSLLFAGFFIFATSPFVIIMCTVAYAVLMVVFFRM